MTLLSATMQTRLQNGKQHSRQIFHASSLHKPTTGNCSLGNLVIPSMLISTASPHIEALGSQFVDLHIARYDPILTLVKLLSSSKAFRQSASTRSHALHNQNKYY